MTEDKRPYFGKNQVRWIEELVIGKKYGCHYGVAYKTQIITIASIEDCLVKVKHDDSDCIGTKLMADLGIIPYSSGAWNSTNWLEKCEENKMEYEEVELVEEREECGLPKINMKDIEPIEGNTVHFKDGCVAICASSDYSGLLRLDEGKVDWKLVIIEDNLYLIALKKDC